MPYMVPPWTLRIKYLFDDLDTLKPNFLHTAEKIEVNVLTGFTADKIICSKNEHPLSAPISEKELDKNRKTTANYELGYHLTENTPCSPRSRKKTKEAITKNNQ